jgi:hypothetical protein
VAGGPEQIEMRNEVGVVEGGGREFEVVMKRGNRE